MCLVHRNIQASTLFLPSHCLHFEEIPVLVAPSVETEPGLEHAATQTDTSEEEGAPPSQGPVTRPFVKRKTTLLPKSTSDCTV